MTAELVEHHERQCNRYVNGFCQTRACLRRGGWQGRPDDEVPPFPDERATCLAHETALTLRAIPAQQQRDVFDLLEAVAEGLLKAGFVAQAQRLQASFSRFTGGVDYEWLGRLLALSHED